MKHERAFRRSIDELPIPEDARINSTWSPLMIEIAECIGAYKTLLLIDQLGGTECYVPREPASGRLETIVGPSAAAALSDMFGGERLVLPAANAALRRARRAPVLDAVRKGRMNKTEAAMVLSTSRRRVAELVNKFHEDEAPGQAARRVSTGQRLLPIFESDELEG